MDRNAYRDEDGTDQPDTYWRRRVLTLVAGLALLGILAWSFSGGGGKPTHPAAASSSPATSITPAAAYSGAPASAGATPSAASPPPPRPAPPAAERPSPGRASRTPATSAAATSTADPSSRPSQATVEPGGGCA